MSARRNAGKAATLALLAWCPTPVRCQTAYGLITGAVRDAAGGAPLDAVVRYANLSTGAHGETTAAGGVFTLTTLSPGIYRLSASIAKYQDRVIEQLELPVAGRFDVLFEMWPLSDPWHSGAYSSVVMPGSHAVSAYYGPDIDASRSDSFAPVGVNTSLLEAAVSTVIDSRALSDLPLTGRDAYALLVLLPGVTADTTTARGLGFSVNGQRPSASNYLLDGLENNNSLVTGPLGVVAPETLQEYRISTSNYSAEYGRTSGFIANAVSRDGGNRWHGIAYLHLKNEAFDANGFQENANGIARAPLREFQPGGSIAGPVWGDRLSVSGSIELLRFRSRADPQDYLLPTTSFIQSLTPGTFAAHLLQAYPAAVPAGGASSTGFVRLAPPSSIDSARGLARADYASPYGAHRAFARVLVARARQPDLLYNPYPRFSSPFHQGVVSAGAGWTWQPRPTFTHELRAGRTGDLAQYGRPHAEVPQLLIDAQTLNPRDGRYYQLQLPQSASSFGYWNTGQNWEIVDNWTWVHGRHIWKAGGGFLQRTTQTAFTAERDGEFFYHTLADFQADMPYRVLASFDRASPGFTPVPYNRTYRYRQADAFVQDSFRVTSRFAVNLGLRYDRFQPPVNIGPAKDLPIALSAGASLADQLTNAQPGSLPVRNQRLFGSDTCDWSVRTGLAYDVTGNGRTVVRGSYGIFYDRPFDNLWQILPINRELTGVWNLSGAVSSLYPALAVAQTGTFLQDTQFHSPLLIDQAIRNPRVQSAFTGVTRRLADGMTLEVNALASRGRRLWTTDVVNRAFSVTPTALNNNGRYAVAFGDINYRSDAGESDYRALTATLRFRLSWLSGQTSYTWSHATDNQSDPLSAAFVDYNQAGLAGKPAQNVLAAFTQQFTVHVDHGNADFDQRHNLVFFAVCKLPGKGRWRQGWQMAGVGAVRSGLPYSVLAPDRTADPEGFLENQRANLTQPALAFSPPPTAVTGGKQVLNPAAFGIPTTGTGNLARNVFAGPGLVSMDLSLSRRFASPWLGEGGRVVVRADFYNALNHANLNNPQSDLSRPDFGQALYGRTENATGFPALTPFNETARQVQLFLRFEF